MHCVGNDVDPQEGGLTLCSVSTRILTPKRVDCEISHQLEREGNITYNDLKISPQHTHFKLMRLTATRNDPKLIISIIHGIVKR